MPNMPIRCLVLLQLRITPLQPSPHYRVEFIISGREHGRVQRRARFKQQRQGADVILRVSGLPAMQRPVDTRAQRYATKFILVRERWIGIER